MCLLTLTTVLNSGPTFNEILLCFFSIGFIVVQMESEGDLSEKCKYRYKDFSIKNSLHHIDMKNNLNFFLIYISPIYDFKGHL